MRKTVGRSTAVLLVIALTGALLAGCGGDKDTKELEEQVKALQLQNQSLQNQLSSQQISEVVTDSSLKQVQATGELKFETIDGLLKFPNPLNLPDTKLDINNSNLMVGSYYSYYPSGNWVMKLNGVQLDVSHPAKIWGSIKAVTTSRDYTTEDIKGSLQGFLKGFPSTTVSYRKVYFSGKYAGMIADTDIEVDKKKYHLTYGFYMLDTYGQTVLFTYQVDDAVVQQELVDSLLKSATYKGTRLTLE